MSTPPLEKKWELATVDVYLLHKTQQSCLFVQFSASQSHSAPTYRYGCKIATTHTHTGNIPKYLSLSNSS